MCSFSAEQHYHRLHSRHTQISWLAAYLGRWQVQYLAFYMSWVLWLEEFPGQGHI